MFIKGLFIVYVLSAVITLLGLISYYFVVRNQVISCLGVNLWRAINRRKRKETSIFTTLLKLFCIIFTPILNTIEAMYLVYLMDDNDVQKIVDNVLADARKDSKRWGIDFEGSIVTGDDYLDSLDELNGIRRL